MDKDQAAQEKLKEIEEKYAKWDAQAKAEEDERASKTVSKRHLALLISAIVAAIIVIYRIMVINSISSGVGANSLEVLGRAIGAQLGARILRPFLIAVGLGAVVNFYAWYSNKKVASIIAIILYALGAIMVRTLWFDAAIPLAIAVVGLVHQVNSGGKE